MNLIIKSDQEILYIHNKKKLSNHSSFLDLINSLIKFSNKYFNSDFIKYVIDDKKIISYYKMDKIEIIGIDFNGDMTIIHMEWVNAIVVDDFEEFRRKMNVLEKKQNVI